MIKCKQGGRGHGLTLPQQILLQLLQEHTTYEWIPEFTISTGRKPPYPTYYGVDIACPELRICIEIDGASHRHPMVRKSDSRKTRFLRNSGYSVIRITNMQALSIQPTLSRIDRIIKRRKLI